MDRYRWNILGLCEMSWKKFGKTTTEEGHKVFSSKKKKRINRAWRRISCSQGHREHCHGMSPSLQQSYHHPPEGSPFQHHNCTSIRPNIRLQWQRNRRIIWPATECHWSDTEEGHSCCTRRLAGMLVETGKAFVDPSAMMTQMREDSDFCSLPPLMTLCWRTHLVITKHLEDRHGIAQWTTPQPDW